MLKLSLFACGTIANSEVPHWIRHRKTLPRNMLIWKVFCFDYQGTYSGTVVNSTPVLAIFKAIYLTETVLGCHQHPASAILPLRCESVNSSAASRWEVVFPGEVNVGGLGPECHMCVRGDSSA